MNMEKLPSAIENVIEFPVEFYDVDSMRVVWHGNYVKYMEKSRCALLNDIGYGYIQMLEDGFEFPIVDLKFKYIRSLRFGEHCRIKSRLVEYENCIKIKYEFYCAESGLLTTRAESTQMCVNCKTGESLFVCPQKFTDLVEKKLNEIKK